jgi:hypothetical protein
VCDWLWVLGIDDSICSDLFYPPPSIRKQETVGRACGKLLSDAGAGKEERRLRAQGK